MRRLIFTFIKRLLWIPGFFLSCSLFAAEPNKEDLLATLRANPEDRAALYNLGLFNYLNGSPGESVEPWTRLESLDPGNWKLKVKLVQAYSAIGETARREAKIAELKRMRASGEQATLNASRYFVRDQFVVGDLRVNVIEFFNMDAGFPLGPVLWKFDLIRGDRSIGRFLSLGSYDGLTQHLRQKGEIAENDRMFHLDAYGPNRKHSLLGMYRNQPAYDLIREHVVNLLQQELKSG